MLNLPYRRFVIGRTLLAVGSWQVKDLRSRRTLNTQLRAAALRWPRAQFTSAHNARKPAQNKTIRSGQLAALALAATKLTSIGLPTSVWSTCEKAWRRPRAGRFTRSG